MVCGSAFRHSHRVRNTLFHKGKRGVDAGSCCSDLAFIFASTSHHCSKIHEFAGNGALLVTVAIKMEAVLVFVKRLGILVKRN